MLRDRLACHCLPMEEALRALARPPKISTSFWPRAALLALRHMTLTYPEIKCGGFVNFTGCSFKYVSCWQDRA